MCRHRQARPSADEPLVAGRPRSSTASPVIVRLHLLETNSPSKQQQLMCGLWTDSPARGGQSCSAADELLTTVPIGLKCVRLFHVHVFDFITAKHPPFAILFIITVYGAWQYGGRFCYSAGFAVFFVPDLRHFSLFRHNPHCSTRLCTVARYKCIDWLIDHRHRHHHPPARPRIGLRYFSVLGQIRFMGPDPPLPSRQPLYPLWVSGILKLQTPVGEIWSIMADVQSYQIVLTTNKNCDFLPA